MAKTTKKADTAAADAALAAVCRQEDLAAGLAAVRKAVAAKSSLPILSCVLIEADGPGLKLSATNLQMGVSIWVAANVSTPGRATVPAQLLSEFVGALPRGEVTLEVDAKNSELALCAGAYRAHINSWPPDDFPLLPTVDEGTEVRIAPDHLREMIAQARVSVATDQARPALTGILVVVEPTTGQLSMAAADGFRLSLIEQERGAVQPAGEAGAVVESIRVLVPADAMAELARAESGEGEQVLVVLAPDGRRVMFRLGACTICSYTIDAEFPDYERIVPREHTTRAVMDTKAFQRAVKISALFARDGANVVRLAFVPGDDAGAGGGVTVEGKSDGGGGNETELDAVVEGPPIEIAFNAKYLHDALGVVGDSQVALAMNTPQTPGVVCGASGGPFKYVLMPVNIEQHASDIAA